MKRKLKEGKGITLVALIITIIVLLILAIVTISAVNEGDIFAHANNAATRHSEEAERENQLLTDLLGNIPGENTPPLGERWTESDTDTYTKGDKTVQKFETLQKADVEDLGFEITGSYSGDWQVIGLTNDGKLKLVSKDNVFDDIYLGCDDSNIDFTEQAVITAADINGNGSLNDFEKAVYSYQNAVNNLNKVAANAVTGNENDNRVRSVNLEDIYGIAGTLTEQEIKDYDGGTRNTNYGSTRTYTSGKFVINGEVVSAPQTITQTYFRYTWTSEEIGSLASGGFVLASQCARCEESFSAEFGIRIMMNSTAAYGSMFYASGMGAGGHFGRSSCCSFHKLRLYN